VGLADFEATVRQKTTDELVAARMKEITKFASDQLALAQRTLKRDGAYFALPADWSSQMVALDALRLPRVVRKSIVWPGWTSPLSR
jgi:hypothetical protein